jgi:uncharacterized membrane protein YkvA (DUF1232 family)
MAHQLTYADRELLLQAFDSLKPSSGETDDHIRKAVGEWSRGLQPSFGFELALTRDVTVLARYLTGIPGDRDIAEIARGPLLYVLHSEEVRSPIISELGLMDEAFVCNYAVYEIRTRLGQPAIYNPPKLTQDEMKIAEGLLLGFIDSPLLSDDKLVETSKEISGRLGNLAKCGFFKRLQRNIGFLVSVLTDSSRSPEQHSYSRAALSYLVCEEDLIDDKLGIIGYLDDNFVSQLGVDLIEPAGEPWLELLDATVGEWPFINGLIIDDGAGGRPFSEFMIVNSAVSCPGIRDISRLNPSILILPDTGPVPFLLGVVATLGLIQDSEKQEVSEGAFSIGQKVLVDHHAVAEFTGFKVIEGRKRFGLKQERIKMGRSQPCTRYWPVSELSRIVPIDTQRSTRGRLVLDRSLSESPLPALEFLFPDGRAAQLSGVSKRVIVVTQVTAAREISELFTGYGYQIKDSVPIGHLTSEDRIVPWSGRFGQQEPLLIFVSDLDEACQYVEKNQPRIAIAVVDATGRNAGKAASLQRLRQLKIPTLVVSSQRLADQLNLIDEQIALWEWNEKDFSALLWAEVSQVTGSGPILKYERRMQSWPLSSLEIKSIPFPPSEKAFDAINRFRMCVWKRGEDTLEEMEAILALALKTLSHLLRAAFAFKGDIPSTSKIEADIDELSTIRRKSRYMSEKEQSTAAEVEVSLKSFFIRLQGENPKAELLYQLLSNRRDSAIICPDTRVHQDLEHVYPHRGARIMLRYDDDNGGLPEAIIPGWFRKDRMAELLVPPIAKRVYLLLYNVEQEWYSDFLLERRKACQARQALCNRAKLFPKIQAWRKPQLNLPELAETVGESKLQELEAIQEHVRVGQRQRVCSAAKSDGTEAEIPARLVLFDGGWYAFLTESYRAVVVTHLLDGLVENQEEADTKQKPVIELKPGDALLFHLGSDRDVIRTAADRDLAPGVRATSSLWRTALLNYFSRQRLTPEELWKRLSAGGCPLVPGTIIDWLNNDDMIAPQAYNRDVGVIAKVTGDETLAGRMEEVLTAISEVRSAHLRVSRQLARRVLAKAVNILKEEGKHSAFVEIEPNVVLTRIIEMDDQPSPVRTSVTNRLLEGEKWHE